MADISKITIESGTYDIKDNTARTNIGTLSNLDTTDKTDLVSAINETLEAVNLNNELLKDKKVILIGDSLGVGNNWGGKFIDYTDCDGQNCCSGSAGFLSKGNTSPYTNMNFSEILTYVINSKTSEELAEIEYLIVAGGINDALNTYAVSDIKNAVQSFISIAKTNLPNAKIYLFPVNTFKWPKNIELDRFNAIIDTARSNGVTTTDYFMYWLSCNSSYNYGDDVHLTSTGYELLAHYIEGFIYGSNLDNEEVITFSFNNNWEASTHFIVYKKGSRIYAKGLLHKTGGSAPTSNESILTFTNGARITGANAYNLLVPVIIYNAATYTGIVSSLNIQNGTISLGLTGGYTSFTNCFVYVNIEWTVGISGDLSAT